MAGKPLQAKMEGLREEELARIAFGDESHGFEEDYVEAAKAEIQRRGISTNTVENLRAEIDEEKIVEDGKADEPLSPFARVLFLIFGALWITWIATAVLKSRGYDQKFRDAWRWILYGFAGWACVAALFLISDITSR